MISFCLELWSSDFCSRFKGVSKGDVGAAIWRVRMLLEGYEW